MGMARGESSTNGERRGSLRWGDFFVRLVKRKPLGTISAVIVLILILVAIFADVLAPYPYDEIHLIDRLQGPSAQYLLGTDQAGRDLLSRLIFGARVSMLRRFGNDHAQCCDQHRGRRHRRIPGG